MQVGKIGGTQLPLYHTLLFSADGGHMPTSGFYLEQEDPVPIELETWQVECGADGRWTPRPKHGGQNMPHCIRVFFREIEANLSLSFVLFQPLTAQSPHSRSPMMLAECTTGPGGTELTPDLTLQRSHTRAQQEAGDTPAMARTAGLSAA